MSTSQKVLNSNNCSRNVSKYLVLKMPGNKTTTEHQQKRGKLHAAVSVTLSIPFSMPKEDVLWGKTHLRLFSNAH